MPDIAYQNKDITSKILGEKLKHKSFAAYGLHTPKILQVLPTNLPAVEANELRLDNLFFERAERELRDKIEAGEPLSEEYQMRFIILPLTHRGKEAKQACIRRCFDLAREMEDKEAKSFLLSGMLVFSDKVIARKDSKRIKEWLMLTKVGQLFEEEKLEYAQKLVEEEKEHTVVKMLKKGFPVSEILELIDGITEADVELIQKNMK